ncbi:MAG: HEPN domain-containing protein [Desulfobaccales bacterium]|jgi:hypothetical protein
MHNTIQHFRANIERTRALGGLYEALSRLTTSAIDVTDLLRAQIVLAVSALDHYIHEITRLGMLEVLSQSRPQTNTFQNFHVTMNAAISGVSGGAGTSWFDDEIRQKHSYMSFQQPDKIADAIRLFSSCKLWPEVAPKLSMSVEDLKTRLKLIVDRRNKIAHEADLDPTYPGVRWPIFPADVTNAINFIESLCEAIHSVVV